MILEDAVQQEPSVPVRATLGELAGYFTRLGFTAFGGPAAHIAIMDREVVTTRRWVSRSHWMDLLAATQLVPGPNSTEMAIHVGYLHRGIPGMLVSGGCFILPAFGIVVLISIFYVAYGALPAVGALLYGIQPVVVAIVAFAAYTLSRNSLKNAALWLLAIVGVLLTLLGFDTVWIILGGGFVGVALAAASRRQAAMTLLPLLATVPALLQQAAEPSLWRLGLFFLKVGATLLGSGYVLVSYLDSALVQQLGWLNPQQLLDSISVGQMTPGPVFTTAAFVGYVVMAGPQGNVAAGLLGAVVGAVGIFLPSFFIVALMSPWVERLRRWWQAGAFLDGVNAVVVGSIAATSLVMLRAAVFGRQPTRFTLPLGSNLALDLPALLLFVAALALLVRRPRLNSTYLIVGGALLGLLVRFLF